MPPAGHRCFARSRTALWLLFLCLALASGGRPSSAESIAPRRATVESVAGHRTYRSAHFMVHTDASAAEAAGMLKRLEATLAWAKSYWGRPSTGVIECYSVADLRRWPKATLPAAARQKIVDRAGVTFTDTLTLNGRHVAAKAIVYAPAEGGSLAHEAVHAYCGQTWGTAGPLWYAEGMAELGQYRLPGGGVGCHRAMADYLRQAPRRSAAQVVRETGTTGDGWRNYAWRWALCHMLAHNPNYAGRFRAFGRGLLDGQPRTFGDEFAAVADQLEFEYRFFVDRVKSGYRVDLCRWDWKHSFSPLSAAAKIECKVLARRGWQATRVLVEAGASYEVSTAGQWRTEASSPHVNADGGQKGRGRLIGAVLSDYKLSKPFLVGQRGTFVAPVSGKLYVRCQDAWNELADNEGTMQVRLRRSSVNEPQINADERRWSTTKSTVLNSHR